MGNTEVKSSRKIEVIQTYHVKFEQEGSDNIFDNKSKDTQLKRKQSLQLKQKKYRKRFNSLGSLWKQSPKEKKQSQICETEVDDLDEDYYCDFRRMRLERMFNTKSFEIVYNSSQQEVSQRELNSIIQFKQDLILLCSTENQETIGCTFHNTVSGLNVKVENIFIITPDKTRMLYPKEDRENDFGPKVSTTQDSSIIFSVYGAFWLTKSMNLSFNSLLEHFYDHSSIISFTKKTMKLKSFCFIIPNQRINCFENKID